MQDQQGLPLQEEPEAGGPAEGVSRRQSDLNPGEDGSFPRPVPPGRPEVQALNIRLEIFEGPLDLLLHLIRTQELDIYDIPIAQVTDQYLAFLDVMKDLNINIAGEFLVMAAQLILIKSRMLLPPDPSQAEDEEFIDPRAELVDQLLEYEKFKNAADLLYERETVELGVHGRGWEEFAEDEKEIVDVNVFDLVKAFHQIVERYKEQVVIEVEHEPATIEEKMTELRRLLSLKREIFFSMFFQSQISKFHIVLTFFALLELVRMEEVRLYQKGVFEDIRIKAC
ncbi:MAG TPA: segregation/condensation protein A [Acidobacteriota bacterium]|nr:segregation/condensation protein A [Acidobacteriota bacterium]